MEESPTQLRDLQWRRGQHPARQNSTAKCFGGWGVGQCSNRCGSRAGDPKALARVCTPAVDMRLALLSHYHDYYYYYVSFLCHWLFCCYLHI